MTDLPEERRELARPKHAGKGVRHGLKAGCLPKSLKYIETRMNVLRRQIEAVVLDAKGEISLNDAAFIQTAMRWERHAALALRWLSKALDELTPEQKLHFSREIAKASAERDKAIANLRLDARDNNLPWLNGKVVS